MAFGETMCISASRPLSRPLGYKKSPSADQLCNVHALINCHWQITESTQFPSGSSVQFRCNSSLPGFYALEGRSTITCTKGKWTHRMPYCRNTSTPESFDGNLSTVLPYMLVKIWRIHNCPNNCFVPQPVATSSVTAWTGSTEQFCLKNNLPLYSAWRK